MKEKPASRQPQDKFIVRFPDGMRDRIAEAAAANGRSMNAEIVQRIEQTFAPQQGDSKGFVLGLRQMADELLGLINNAESVSQLRDFIDGVPDEEAGARKEVNAIMVIPDFLRTPEQRFIVEVIKGTANTDGKISNAVLVELLRRSRAAISAGDTPESVIEALAKWQEKQG